MEPPPAGADGERLIRCGGRGFAQQPVAPVLPIAASNARTAACQVVTAWVASMALCSVAPDPARTRGAAV